MIDTLFGSKTRVKLLHLFFSNPSESFYVREITRKIGEQINSVRRELSNMLDVGVITNDSVDNKLYYQVNQRYEFYVPLRLIFSDDKTSIKTAVLNAGRQSDTNKYDSLLKGISGLKVAIFAGVLVEHSTASLDVVLAGDISSAKVKAAIKEIERIEGREINYAVLSYDEFYYRLSVHDKFIAEVMKTNHRVMVDKENILVEQKVEG
jgi:hypothetical protein